MPSCWPPCSPWCSCNTATGQCIVRPVSINAIRLRTPDGRFLQSPASGRLLTASTVAAPGPSETFLFASALTGPLTSGTAIELRGCAANFAPSGAQMRVDHSVVVLPTGGKHPGPPLVTYEIGGPGMAVLVSGPLPQGYPAYRADDPAEWTFDILKAGGGPIADGDTVSLRINSNLGRTFFFRVSGGQSGAGVDGGGTSAAASGTLFIVTLNEVLPGTGWRPAAIQCRSCANVLGSVLDQTSKAAIGGAFVEALDVFENHQFTGTTETDGRFALLDHEGRTCIPSGPVRFRARADRHQTKVQGPITLPASGVQTVTIELDCTNLSGVVVDQVDRPMAGVAVSLVDMNHMPILGTDGQPFVVTTGMNGDFVFRCVPHGTVWVWLMMEPTRFHPVPVPPEGASVKIVAQAVCGNLIGTVKNAVTSAPIAMAAVAIIGQARTTQTNANGEFRLDCVRPAGSQWLLASAVGFTIGGGFGTAPMTGDSAPVDIRLQPLAVASIAIRLDWGALPGDLDLRLTGPDNMGGRFQVMWAFPNPVSYARLDQDVRTGFGPETITVTALIVGTFVPGTYRVWVFNVTGGLGGPSYEMSDAVVTVVTMGASGLNQIGRFEVADATGMQDMTVWYVCDLDVTANGVVTVTPVESLVPNGPP